MKHGEESLQGSKDRGYRNKTIMLLTILVTKSFEIAYISVIIDNFSRLSLQRKTKNSVMGSENLKKNERKYCLK